MAARAKAHTVEINSSHVAMISHPGGSNRPHPRCGTSEVSLNHSQHDGGPTNGPGRRDGPSPPREQFVQRNGTSSRAAEDTDGTTINNDQQRRTAEYVLSVSRGARPAARAARAGRAAWAPVPARPNRVNGQK